MSNQTAIHCLVMLLVSGMGACVEVRDPNAQGPDGPGILSVAGRSDPSVVFEGATVVLSAEVANGTSPVSFVWDQNGGAAATMATPASSETRITGLSQPGRYVFRITAVDAAGRRGIDFVAVDVLAAVTVESPPFAVVGEPAELRAQVAAEAPDPSFLWEVVRGSADLDEASAAAATLTGTAGETVGIRLTVSFAGDTQPAATREVDIVVVANLSPRVRVETSGGDFVIELDGQNTPRHMVNFLRYVDEGFYEGLLFHRNACTPNPDTDECDPFVIQGGGFRRDGEDIVAVDPTHDPIESETESSASNGELYTVALALRGGSTATGAAQFFINLSENDFLDESGFTVFGRVVEGTGVVDALAATDRVASPVIPGEESLPAEDIVIERIIRAD